MFQPFSACTKTLEPENQFSMSQEFFLCVGAVFVCRNSFRIPWDGMPHPRAYPMFHDEINFLIIPNFILSIRNFFEVKIPSGLIVEIRWSWKSCQPDPCAWPRVQLVKDSNPFVMPLLNLRFFSCHFDIITFIFGYWMDKISLMGGGKKLCHGKLRDASENHREKYFEESFCMKRLLDFFSMIAMCQKLSDGYENSSGGVRFSDGCEMACGEGARQVWRQSIANYLKRVCRGIYFIQKFTPISSFLHLSLYFPIILFLLLLGQLLK